jgi:hypothetical protein
MGGKERKSLRAFDEQAGTFYHKQGVLLLKINTIQIFHVILAELS